MLTVREAAEKIGASPVSVRMWAKSGRIPGAKLEESPAGSYWLIPESVLDGFEMGKAGRPPKAKTKTRRSKG